MLVLVEPKELLVVELMELVEQEEVCQEGTITITTTAEVAAAAAVEEEATLGPSYILLC